MDFDISAVTTPAFVVDERLIADNLSVLSRVKEETGCRILLALKCFSMSSTFGEIRKVLDGTCASSVHEAMLGKRAFGGEVHAFAAAFSKHDMDALLPICHHLVFNSFSQWERFRGQAGKHENKVSCGIRVNPEKSMGATPIYDPCAPGSRLGVRRAEFQEKLLDGIEGLHFHALCEQDSTELEPVLEAFEKNFGEYLPRMKWVNFGGGHHISRDDYDVELLIDLINGFKERHPHLTIYLEPGEAIALNAGFLVAEVLDITQASDMPVAILDTSAACHMPDVIEMPYRPFVIGSGEKDENPFAYRLAGLTCLAGDTIGEYSFDRPLAVGNRLVFTDMAIYSMVKTNTFNGIGLPSIYRIDTEGELHLERRFGFEDFAGRLA